MFLLAPLHDTEDNNGGDTPVVRTLHRMASRVCELEDSPPTDWAHDDYSSPDLGERALPVEVPLAVRNLSGEQ